MVLYPEVQRRAQAEIDRIIGTDRLPTFDDIDNLPYLGAIYKETLRQVIVELTPDFHFPLNYMSRWQPVVPLGMYSDTKLHMFVKLKIFSGAPHVLTQDDIYGGYFIPKGTIVFPNVWSACSYGLVGVSGYD